MAIWPTARQQPGQSICQQTWLAGHGVYNYAKPGCSCEQACRTVVDQLQRISSAVIYLAKILGLERVCLKHTASIMCALNLCPGVWMCA
jgi:hypothetical protein